MWPQLVIVTLLAAVAQGVAGFGFTLLAVSFYLLILRSTDAVQLVILINLTISVVVMTRLWRAVPWRLWALLAGGGLLGFPAGLWLFARADLALVELAVAAVTIAFALTVLLREGRAVGVAAAAGSAEGSESAAHEPLPALAIGACAGALTSSLGAPGPPVVLYLAGLGLDKTTFRALALSSFIVMQLGALAGQAAFVGIGDGVWRLALVLAPVAALGGVIGHGLSHRLSERHFRRLVLVLLLATGAYMAYRAASG